MLHERRETWRLRTGKGRRAACPDCRKEAEWLTVSEAAHITGLSERAIFLLVENSEVHFAEAEDGVLLICLSSLRAINTGPNQAPTEVKK